MDRAGPSGIHPPQESPRKRTRPPDTEEASTVSSSKRVKSLVASKRTVRGSRRRPAQSSPARSRDIHPTSSIPASPQITLELIFTGFSSQQLKGKVENELDLCRTHNDTLTKAVSHLNGNFPNKRTGCCNSVMLFDYIERLKLVEDDELYRFMPLETVIQKAESNPAILDSFFVAWWESGRTFQKCYHFLKNKLQSLKSSPDNTWHPVDILHLSPSLKRKLQAPAEDELDKLYKCLLEKKVNETGRLLLYAHEQNRALELYLQGKLLTGLSIQAISATLNNAHMPARICRSVRWNLKDIFCWLEPRLNIASPAYEALLKHIPLTGLAKFKSSDDNYDFYVACAIRNWVRKNDRLTNIVQYFSERQLMLPEGAQAWESKVFGSVIAGHFDVQTFFPTSLEVIAADYKSAVDSTRRQQMGFELLTRACAGETRALWHYIDCRIFMGEEEGEERLRQQPSDEHSSRQRTCVAIAWKLNQQGIPLEDDTQQRWTGERVNQYFSD